MSEDKLAYTMEQLHKIEVKPLPELSIEKVYEKAVVIKSFMGYMPDDWNVATKVERCYFWNVIHTLAPRFVYDIVDEAKYLRYQRKLGNKPEVTIIAATRKMVDILLRK